MSSKIYPIHTEMDSARNIYKGTSVTVNVCCYRITYINNVPVLDAKRPIIGQSDISSFAIKFTGNNLLMIIISK